MMTTITITNNLLNEGRYFDDALPSCLLFGLLTLFPSEKDIIARLVILLYLSPLTTSHKSCFPVSYLHSKTATTRLLTIERATDTLSIILVAYLLFYSPGRCLSSAQRSAKTKKNHADTFCATIYGAYHTKKCSAERGALRYGQESSQYRGCDLLR